MANPLICKDWLGCSDPTMEAGARLSDDKKSAQGPRCSRYPVLAFGRHDIASKASCLELNGYKLHAMRWVFIYYADSSGLGVCRGAAQQGG